MALRAADTAVPQRVRLFLEGLVRQPGDAISMVATRIRNGRGSADHERVGRRCDMTHW